MKINLKKLVLVIMMIGVISFFNVNLVSAVKDSDDDIIDLDTEEVKNKHEGYSSLTDINGLNLFTDDVKDIIDSNNTNNKDKLNEYKSNLFNADKENSSQDIKVIDNVFNEPVVFETQYVTDDEQIYLILLLTATTIIACVLVLILTLRKYKKKEMQNNENNINVC